MSEAELTQFGKLTTKLRAAIKVRVKGLRNGFAADNDSSEEEHKDH